jgi:predicted nucleotidyltransferase
MTHYWTLERETIYDCACKSLRNKNKSMVKKTVKKQKKDNIYNNLSDEVWLTRKILHRDPLHHI